MALILASNYAEACRAVVLDSKAYRCPDADGWFVIETFSRCGRELKDLSDSARPEVGVGRCGSDGRYFVLHDPQPTVDGEPPMNGPLNYEDALATLSLTRDQEIAVRLAAWRGATLRLDFAVNEAGGRGCLAPLVRRMWSVSVGPCLLVGDPQLAAKEKAHRRLLTEGGFAVANLNRLVELLPDVDPGDRLVKAEALRQLGDRKGSLALATRLTADPPSDKTFADKVRMLRYLLDAEVSLPVKLPW